MKIVKLICAVFCLHLLGSHLSAQVSGIKPIILTVSDRMTSNIIFPTDILSADRGSQDILVQKASGAENILQVKAASKSFETSNISVVTKGAHFYSFIVSYQVLPAQLNILIKDNAESEAVRLSDFPVPQDFSLTSKPFLNKSKSSLNCRLTLKSIYIHNGVLLFGLQINNTSLLDYPIEAIHLFIRDKQRAKRKAQQSVDLENVFSTLCPIVKGKQKIDVVVGVRSFTIPKNKQLMIELQEKNGGRNIYLPVKSKTVLKARPY